MTGRQSLGSQGVEPAKRKRLDAKGPDECLANGAVSYAAGIMASLVTMRCWGVEQ